MIAMDRLRCDVPFRFWVSCSGNDDHL
jgi:hypothetical protein